jgi:ADP-heptose:LPS heptosyltransferase
MPRNWSRFPLLILGMGGLGDGVYQRPFVRAQAEARPVYITTPWPELYSDLPDVHPVEPWSMNLRTQLKNIARHPSWATVPRTYTRANFTYSLRDPGTIVEELERHVPLDGHEFIFDLPDFGPSPVTSSKPIAVIRPVTIRKEWPNFARAPRPEYVAEAARMLMDDGYHVVAVADIDPPSEYLVGEMPPAHDYFVQGELTPREVLALMQHSAVVVGGVGFIVPVAIAQRVPLVVIAGGQGRHNAPKRVTDPRMDTSRARFILPDIYCECAGRHHQCPKAISGFDGKFRAALHEVAA